MEPVPLPTFDPLLAFIASGVVAIAIVAFVIRRDPGR